MSANGDIGRGERLEAMLKLVRAKVAPAQRALVEEFAARYFQDVDPEDLAERQPADLYGAALSHWNFARKREPGRARMRVFNPTLEEHGWQSTHTIVEIVNDDMPFLVDSVTMEVNRHGLTLHLIIHPIVAVERGADGTLTRPRARGRRGRAARVVHPRRGRPHRRAGAPRGAGRRHRRVLDDVRAAVDDWKPMRERVHAIVAEVEKRAPPLPAEELAEGKAFLRWLADNHFTLPRLSPPRAGDGRTARTRCKIVPGSSLGILREGPSKDVAASFAALPPEVRAYARRPELLVITKATSRSTVHRPGYLDYIARQALRRQGQGRRRGSLPRPVHLDRLQRQSRRDSAAAAQGRQRRRARGPARRQPRRQGAAQHPRHLSARRAVPDRRGRSAAHRDGDPASRGPPALPPVRPPRRRSSASSRA